VRVTDCLLPHLPPHDLLLALVVERRLCVFDGKIVASVEQRYSHAESSVRVRIWTAATLVTETTFDESLDDHRLIGTFFTPNVCLFNRRQLHSIHSGNRFTLL
jgi:hypothetical protein